MPGAPLHHVGWATKLKLRGFGVFDGSRNGERRLSSCQQDFAARVYTVGPWYVSDLETKYKCTERMDKS
jgi:hypothetical protein